MLHHIIKELASMRLPADRRNFEEVGRHPLQITVFDCSNGTQGCQMQHPAVADRVACWTFYQDAYFI